MKERKVTAEDVNQENIKPNKLHGDWNYEIHPCKNR